MKTFPPYIKKESSNIKKFKSLLKTFLLDNIFYSLDELFNFFIDLNTIYCHLYMLWLFTVLSLYY